MSLGEFMLGAVRLAAILAPAWLAARRLRATGAATLSGATAILADAIATLALLLLAAELLGLVGLLRVVPLILLLWAVAFGVLAALGRRTDSGRFSASLDAGEDARETPKTANEPSASRPATGATPSAYRRGQILAASAGVVVVAAQWLLQSANALGSGMLNFDTLWYHMPFAAQFARSGSVTAIQFTQADPYVAYYPANSELLHALGILALHGDFLSPLLNLLWLAIALLAAWCLGRRRQVQPLTLLAGCLVVSLPVLAGTQPGEAFNDIPGLACLLAACALALEAEEDVGALAIAGLALGFAAGVKFTFLVPALALILALGLTAAPGRRRRVLLALLAPTVLCSVWWYLRNLIAVGNPLGLGLHLGPLRLPGPSSALADAQSQTVISELSHTSLWGSRFEPGLGHALGPLWPLIVVLYLAGVLGGLLATRDRRVRVLALVAGLAGISYLLFPTGASGIEQDTVLFEVNLRYATPALLVAIPLIPILVRLRAPRLLGALAAALLAILLAGQFEHSLWPTQTSRHLALLAACGALAGAALLGRAVFARRETLARPRAAAGRRLAGANLRLVATGAVVLIVLAAAFLAQRHYFARRYLIGFGRNVALGEIYRWAQGVSHERVALYASAEQYPLYGARDTNAVDYLGEDVGDGGYRPISSCGAWRERLRRGRYAYVVLTPAPTRAIPLSWTAQDPGATLVLSPAPDFYVYKLSAAAGPVGCS
ncbi:MAG TPA: hypothetical protein VHW67_14010 [Solirubrobacteraceae bacterium]|jgi:hypothetical protein|nr:hypothetical protein [Solirubrobacteraceae bacterium]